MNKAAIAPQPYTKRQGIREAGAMERDVNRGAGKGALIGGGSTALLAGILAGASARGPLSNRLAAAAVGGVTGGAIGAVGGAGIGAGLARPIEESRVSGLTPEEIDEESTQVFNDAMDRTGKGGMYGALGGAALGGGIGVATGGPIGGLIGIPLGAAGGGAIGEIAGGATVDYDKLMRNARRDTISHRQKTGSVKTAFHLGVEAGVMFA